MLLDLRGTQLVQEGRTAEAVQAVAKLRELGTATAGQLYNAACVDSLCAGRLGAAPSLLTAEQAAERQKHIAHALETLREAIKAGYKDFAHMQKDPTSPCSTTCRNSSLCCRKAMNQDHSKSETER